MTPTLFGFLSKYPGLGGANRPGRYKRSRGSTPGSVRREQARAVIPALIQCHNRLVSRRRKLRPPSQPHGGTGGIPIYCFGSAANHRNRSRPVLWYVHNHSHYAFSFLWQSGSHVHGPIDRSGVSSARAEERGVQSSHPRQEQSSGRHQPRSYPPVVRNGHGPGRRPRRPRRR